MKQTEEREIDCREALNLVAAYVDRQTSSQDTRDLEKHLRSCRHCFDRVEFEKLLKERLKGLRVEKGSTDISPEIKRLLENL